MNSGQSTHSGCSGASFSATRVAVWGKAPVPLYCSGGTVSLGTRLRVEYMPGPGDAPKDQQLRPHFRLVNTGSTDIPLSNVVVRYYFTGNAGTYNTFFDYVAMGPGVSGSVLALSPRAGANRYLELHFSSSLGTLVAGADTGRIETRVSRSDFATLDETDDYSYKPSSTFAAQMKIVTLVAGAAIWGTPP
jgi:hypothetical protein